MTIHITRLVCNVTITGNSGSGSEGTIQRATGDDELQTTTRQPGSSEGSGGSRGIDPRALADRVYRLMRRDLELARERE